MKQYYTINGLAQEYGLSNATIKRMLSRTNTKPNGTDGRWQGYSKELFEKAKEEYYAKYVDGEPGDDIPEEIGISERLQIAKLRVQEAMAEEKEIFIAKQKNELVSRKSAESMLFFVVNMFVQKLRDITRNIDNDELYNTLVEDAYKEIESYINEKGFGYMIDEKSQKEIEQVIYETARPEYEI